MELNTNMKYTPSAGQVERQTTCKSCMPLMPAIIMHHALMPATLVDVC